MTPEQAEELAADAHKKRHEFLHRALDELVADWLVLNPNHRPSQYSILDLMRWSHSQTIHPGDRSETLRHSSLAPYTTAAADPDLLTWLLNAQQYAGDFLKNAAEAGLRADQDNYPLLRPTLLELKAKYPKYGRPS